MSFEGSEGSSCSDTGWQTVPCTSSRHTERAATRGAESRSRYVLAPLKLRPYGAIQTCILLLLLLRSAAVENRTVVIAATPFRQSAEEVWRSHVVTAAETSTAGQNCILSRTDNQWRSWRCVTWSYLCACCSIKHGLQTVQQVTVKTSESIHCHNQVVS